MDTDQPILGYASVQRGRKRNANRPSQLLAFSSFACSAIFFILYAMLNTDHLHSIRASVPFDLEPLLPLPLFIGFGLALISRMVTDADVLLSSIALLVAVYALFLNAFGFDFVRGMGF